MAGLFDTDIKLDGVWQLTRAANGDAPLVSGIDCFLQDIQIEALSQEGELFYDESWGWSLLDFVQSQDDELTRIEIEQRIKTKLARRSEIDAGTIKVSVDFIDDQIVSRISFKFIGNEQEYQLNVSLDRIKVEVVIV